VLVIVAQCILLDTYHTVSQVHAYHTIRCHIYEDYSLHICRHQKLKSRLWYYC